MKTIIIFTLILLSTSLSYGQDIKTTKTHEGFVWQLTEYTLPDFICQYRITDKNNSCIQGGTMNPIDFYTVNYFPSKTQNGKYKMTVIISETKKILFIKEFELK